MPAAITHLKEDPFLLSARKGDDTTNAFSGIGNLEELCLLRKSLLLRSIKLLKKADKLLDGTVDQVETENKEIAVQVLDREWINQQKIAIYWHLAKAQFDIGCLAIETTTRVNHVVKFLRMAQIAIDFACKCDVLCRNQLLLEISEYSPKIQEQFEFRVMDKLLIYNEYEITIHSLDRTYRAIPVVPNMPYFMIKCKHFLGRHLYDVYNKLAVNVELQHGDLAQAKAVLAEAVALVNDFNELYSECLKAKDDLGDLEALPLDYVDSRLREIDRKVSLQESLRHQEEGSQLLDEAKGLEQSPDYDSSLYRRIMQLYRKVLESSIDNLTHGFNENLMHQAILKAAHLAYGEGDLAQARLFLVELVVVEESIANQSRKCLDEIEAQLFGDMKNTKYTVEDARAFSKEIGLRKKVMGHVDWLKWLLAKVAEFLGPGGDEIEVWLHDRHKKILAHVSEKLNIFADHGKIDMERLKTLTRLLEIVVDPVLT